VAERRHGLGDPHALIVTRAQVPQDGRIVDHGTVLPEPFGDLRAVFLAREIGAA
jgi:hypothetical protein